MCFSATASYTASFILLLSSIPSFKYAKSNQRMFAAIPLLFSIQQFIEGSVWQSLTALQPATITTYAFLFFVFLVWPLWLPISLYLMSEKLIEKQQLRIPLVSGCIVAFMALISLSQSTPYASILGHHIRYTADLSSWIWMVGTIFYLIATIPPFFIVRIKYLWIMGTIATLSYIISYLFYYQTILSVWCFFAALLSVLTFIVIRNASNA